MNDTWVCYLQWYPGILPEHPERRLEADELLLLVDPEDVPQVDAELDGDGLSGVEPVDGGLVDGVVGGNVQQLGDVVVVWGGKGQDNPVLAS